MNAETQAQTTGATVETTDLRRALALAAMVVNRRNTIPILSHVEMMGDASTDALVIRATDLQQEITVRVPAPGCHDPFRVTANAHDLLRVVRAAGRGAATVRRQGESMCFDFGEMRARFASMDPSDFPRVEIGADPARVTMLAEALRGILARVLHAISTEETRYYLNGVFMEIEGEADCVLRAVATDGHRMALSAAPLPQGGDGWPKPGIIVPRRAVSVLLHMLDGLTDEVTILATPTRVEFATSAGILRTKAIDGTYPEYRRVLPSGGQPYTFRRAALDAAVRRVSALSLGVQGGAVLLSIAGGRADLSAKAAEYDMQETVPCEGDGAAQVGLKGHYFRTTLAQIGGDVTIEIAGGSNPVAFRDAGDPRALFIIMPMRV